MKILLVEDDESLAEVVKKSLISQHYIVDTASDGETGWDFTEIFTYDLILLDVMLPNLDGISFCKKLRNKRDRTPILLLTAQDSSINKVNGLDAGADDYLAKPFDLHELLARVRALLRRGGSTLDPIIEWENLRLNPSSCEVSYQGKILNLTSKEYSILELLLRNPDRIFSQSMLLDRIWELDRTPTENTVRAHIKSLRQKLKKAGATTDLIETVYGLGYRLKTEESENIQQDLLGEVESNLNNTLPSPGRLTLAAEDSSLLTPAVKSNTQLQQQVTLRLNEIWNGVKDNYYDRITNLEKESAILLKGTFNEELREKVQREAHTLIGSLGTFGFTEAANLCRKIENIFLPTKNLTKAQVDPLQKLLVKLRQSLTTPPQKFVEQLPEPTIINTESQLSIINQNVELAKQTDLDTKVKEVETTVVTESSLAREAIAQVKPDVVVLDLSVDNSKEAGFKLLEELKNKQPNLPIVVFTSDHSLVEQVKLAKLEGIGCLQKPISATKIVESLAQLLPPSTMPQARLIIVDDKHHLLLKFLRNLLEPWGFQITLVDRPKQFWETLGNFNSNLSILDVEMPDLKGIDVSEIVSNEPELSDLPLLFLSNRTEVETADNLFIAGSDDIPKPIGKTELVSSVINQLERSHQSQLIEIDQLTGTTNRGRSQIELNKLLNLAQYQKQPLGFAVINLDRLKQINNQYNYDAGDRVLSSLGKILRQSLGSKDIVARWSGNEFVIGLYNMTRLQTIERLNELLEIVRQQQFTDADRQTFHVTFSAGVAEYPQDGSNLQGLYQSADAALSQAKAAGGNCVISLAI